jgi:hypothetical protein
MIQKPISKPYLNFKKQYAVIAGKVWHFDSQYEKNYALYLQYLKEKGEIVDYIKNTTTFPFTEKATYVIRSVLRFISGYRPDFIVFYADDRYEIHEIKGWKNEKMHAQLEQMEKDYPALSVKIIDKEFIKRISKKSISKEMGTVT